ncbi:ankyrin repeat domain-containing protein [Calothrix sp. FACHB-1219]|uniref:ankyrin repeat domain-containing protein n=1 Tax=unclassified Calothrix TaxID=2619626 RepID=UPI001685B60E|nr:MULTISPECIES: ankyrin repeat domain-containing protein [unclassified Calothrix]MBD2203141.1 ankyrin repeat domain-containing protein [Calothrix sp. FACHB-168]MBD2218742.1 ankyrin repeat domain-containing protein [Calothrix sp. FACHB-1219]
MVIKRSHWQLGLLLLFMVLGTPSIPATQAQTNNPEETLIEAVTVDQVDVLKQYLDNGGDPDRYFALAVSNGSMQSVELMLQRGANVNIADPNGITPLMVAARYTYRAGIEMTKFLLEKGALVNAKTKKDSTALMFACSPVAQHYEDDYVKVVKILLAKGAHINVKNKLGATPLNIATQGNWQKIVAVLKKAGAKA